MKPGLNALIHSKSNSKLSSKRDFNASREFFRQYESNNHYVVHGLRESLCSLFRLPFLNSLDDLLRSWPDLIQAHLPDIADEASSIDTKPSDAHKLFNHGMGLLFNHAQKISPELSIWLESIRTDLGLSALTQSRCMIYATPKNKGTAPHFDQNINFVLQIHGTKKWWIAPNRHVENPLTRHTMGLPVDLELQSYSRAPMPNRMPSGITPIVLKPGSLLFVPRGSWHTTEAETDALSLNFTYTAPSWLDLFTAALRSRLALSSEWRETADGVSYPDGAHREIAQIKFDSLLSELVGDLPHWKASDILNATEG